ncbi:MAG: class I SAM-dependent methyltransferase [Planctomycetota bacterium]|jgi:16S rRNA (guanine1516-N2)-methyltransferase|nr:class I SAM-dependent methyltransferase [Planctomycetota bacterium]
MSHNTPVHDVIFLGDPETSAARDAVGFGATVAVDESAIAPEDRHRVRLEVVAGRLQARLPGWPRSAGFMVELDCPTVAEARRSPVVRGAGTPPGVLLDATAGFGTDAVRLAAAGWRVIACERNPWIRWLLDEGLAAAREGAGDRDDLAEVAQRVRLVEIPEAREIMAAIAAGAIEPVDVVLLDPMYPAERRGKAALPPKSAQMLRALAGEDPQAAELVEPARRIARRRVIVKRPAWASPLAEDVAHSIATKLLRIDAYLPIRHP